MSFRRTILVTVGITLLGPCAFAAQQQDQPSVAEAARKNREEKEKKNQPKPTKVYTDDNIGGAGGPVSVVGQAPPATSDSNGNAAAGGQSSGDGPHDKAYWKGKFSAARTKLADDKKNLDLTQRELNLKQTQYYSDPNEAMKQQYSSDELKQMKDKIDKLNADIEKDEQAISDLEDQLRQSGGDPGWAREDDQPSDQTSPESQSPDNNAGSQPSQSQPPAAQDQGSQPQSQPSSQDQGSQPEQAPPSQTPPPSQQP